MFPLVFFKWKKHFTAKQVNSQRLRGPQVIVLLIKGPFTYFRRPVAKIWLSLCLFVILTLPQTSAQNHLESIHQLTHTKSIQLLEHQQFKQFIRSLDKNQETTKPLKNFSSFSKVPNNDKNIDHCNDGKGKEIEGEL